MKFIHLSDLHIKEFGNVEIQNMLVSIRDEYPEHRLIITGDITDNGSIEEYRIAKMLLDPFQGRLYVVPGNHDYGYMGNIYNMGRAQCFDRTFGTKFVGQNNPTIEILNGVVLIGFDSNLETMSPFDFACGEIGELQFMYALPVLQMPNKIKIVYFHHHPFMVLDPLMQLKDAEKLAQMVYGRVDVMLFGHRHVGGMWKGVWNIPWILAADMNRVRAEEISIEDGKVSVKTIYFWR